MVKSIVLLHSALVLALALVAACGSTPTQPATPARGTSPAAATPQSAPAAPRAQAAPAASATATATTNATTTTAAADRIVELLNEHRARAGLPAVARSRSLTLVAEAHVRDLERSPPAGACNNHSWSAGGGDWSACCYTGDHKQARCMWDKPRELTKGKYPGNGYEIAAWFSGRITAQMAVEMWQRSPGHWQVVMNEGIWRGQGWLAVGAAVSEHHAVVWFGREPE